VAHWEFTNRGRKKERLTPGLFQCSVVALLFGVEVCAPSRTVPGACSLSCPSQSSGVEFNKWIQLVSGWRARRLDSVGVSLVFGWPQHGLISLQCAVPFMVQIHSGPGDRLSWINKDTHKHKLVKSWQVELQELKFHLKFHLFSKLWHKCQTHISDYWWFYWGQKHDLIMIDERFFAIVNELE